MTNAEIIYRTSEELVRQGKLAMVGDLPEPIHTFQGWKALGYSVKKGEKSDIRFPIWKHTSKTVVDENNEEKHKTSMFMKTAAFFKFSQVEKVAQGH